MWTSTTTSGRRVRIKPAPPAVPGIPFPPVPEGEGVLAQTPRPGPARMQDLDDKSLSHRPPPCRDPDRLGGMNAATEVHPCASGPPSKSGGLRREPGRLGFPSLEPWMDRWSAGPGRSGAPDEVCRTSSGTRPPSSRLPPRWERRRPDGRDPTQLHSVAPSKTSWEWGAVDPRGRADEPKEPQRPAEGRRLSPARRVVRASPNFRWRTEATLSATHRRPYFRRGE